MSNEKLREVIKRLLKAHRITVQAPPKTITDAENQLREIENAVKYAEEALATTEPAVNQQLTTELDEREAFEKWANDNAIRTDLGAWEAWQARAAMAQVSDINVAESLTNDTKDALMAGRAYAQESLIRFDDAYDRHPSTEPERNAILTDIQLIDTAMAKGVKG